MHKPVYARFCLSSCQISQGRLKKMIVSKPISSQAPCPAHDLADMLADVWPPQIGAGCVIEIGLSGGLDSVVLLHVLAVLRPRFGFVLRTVHVHHGLNAAADEWAAFCADLCCSLDVPLRLEHVNVEAAGLGVEAAARRERYAAFARGGADVLALAHHQDDQVETFMLAALRGGGLRALAAMPMWRPLDAHTQIWRPLLAHTRAQLADYAAANALAYVEDSSNDDTALLRNWLRRQALPAWRQRLPQLDRHLLSSVALLQEEQALLNEVVAADWAEIHQGCDFDLARWRQLSGLRRRQQLLQFARAHSLGMPRYAAVADFERVLEKIQTASAEWRLPHGRALAYRNRLFAIGDDWQQDCAWLKPECSLSGRLNNILTNNGFTLRTHSFGLSEEVLAQFGTVRPISTDEVINLTVGRKSVRKILQECGVLPFVRPYWPIVTDGENRCVAIANVWVNVHYGVAGGKLPVCEKINRFILEPK